MLSAAKRERIRIILKLETTKTVRPGTFITPVEKLTGNKDEEEDASLKRSIKSEDLSEQFKELDEIERRKIEVILQNDEKYNMNIKHNLKSALERIWKSCELEAA